MQRSIGGAFYRKFDGRHPHLLWLEKIARYLSTRHGGTFFGDQSVFVRREIFAKLGGFASIPLMEDMEFSRRLRRSGPDGDLRSAGGIFRAAVISGAARGALRCKTDFLSCSIAAAFHRTRLHRWYYPGAAMLAA